MKIEQISCLYFYKNVISFNPHTISKLINYFCNNSAARFVYFCANLFQQWLKILSSSYSFIFMHYPYAIIFLVREYNCSHLLLKLMCICIQTTDRLFSMDRRLFYAVSINFSTHIKQKCKHV